MKRNIGNIDMIIRLFCAVLFTDLAVDQAIGGRWNILYWCIAIVLCVTALTGFCPLYALFQKNKISHHGSK
jgi:hypothetical protein